MMLILANHFNQISAEPWHPKQGLFDSRRTLQHTSLFERQ
jgi:hypothetical protein